MGKQTSKAVYSFDIPDGFVEEHNNSELYKTIRVFIR